MSCLGLENNWGQGVLNGVGGQQVGCQRMMNVFGNTLRALGNMLKDTKKRAKYIFSIVLFPSIGSTQKGIGKRFFSAKNNCKGDSKGH
jgi:hypothetical protein